MWSQLQSIESGYFNCSELSSQFDILIRFMLMTVVQFSKEGKMSDVSKMSLPWKRPTAKLLYENLTAVLNSFDICALPRVMFAPVLLLFHWRTEESPYSLSFDNSLLRDRELRSEIITSPRLSGATYMLICRGSSHSLDSDICQYLERHLHPPQHSWNNTRSTLMFRECELFPKHDKVVFLWLLFISLLWNNRVVWKRLETCYH